MGIVAKSYILGFGTKGLDTFISFILLSCLVIKLIQTNMVHNKVEIQEL